jgi:hypothetical protein
MHSKCPFFYSKTVERSSVTLTVTPNDEYFLADVLFEGIQAGVVYFHHERDGNINLPEVSYS